jgi:hypothetical protein
MRIEMADKNIWISQLSYKMTVRIIHAYADCGVSATITEVAKKGKIKNRLYVTHASTFLIRLGVIEEDKIKTHRKITVTGSNLARALHLGNSDNIKKCWAELIRDSPYYSLLQNFRIDTEVSKNDLVGAIFENSQAELGSRHNKAGANCIIDILCQSGCIQKINRRSRYLIIRNTLPPNLDKFPSELQPSLERFFGDHPDFSRCAFIMMPFSDTEYYEEFHKKFNDQIFELIREICLKYRIEALRADSKYYAEDILPNIKTYIQGCGLGRRYNESCVKRRESWYPCGSKPKQGENHDSHDKS